MNLKLPYNLLKDLAIFTLTGASRAATYPYLVQKASYRINQRGIIKITKQALTTYLILFFAFSSVAGLFLFNPFGADEADAAWFNDNWAYRKALTLTIDSQSANRSNVYSLLTIDTNLTSTKLQSACQDLRFTDEAGAIIPYYIISTTNCNTNGSNQIWVKIPTVPALSTSQTIYMYYGNPTASAGASAIQQFPLINGLNGYWKMNESSGNAADNSVNANTLTNNNTATYSTGQFGNAGTFASASSQSLSIADASQTGLDNLTTWTISTWINSTTQTSNGYVINKDASNGQCSYIVQLLSSGSVRFNSCSISSGGFYSLSALDTATSLISNSSWYHIAINFDGTTVRFYLNGVETTTGSFPESGSDRSLANTTTSPFTIAGGATNGGGQQYFNGKIDDTRIYNRALSPGDILALYNNPGEAYLSASSTEQTASVGSEAVGPSPTLYWEFDQGQGTTAEDTTANALDGTLNNTPVWQTENYCIASKCLYFDGTSNENVSIADDAKLDFVAADNFTLGAWVKRNGASAANTVILQKTGANIGSTYTGYKMYMDASGDLCFDVQDGTNAVDSACTSAVDFDDDAWHFVEGVKAGTTSITLYVDGKQRAQDASIASTGTLANASTFRVGIDSDGLANDWLGFIDEVKVYRDQTARTAVQVLADYNARSNPEGVAQQQSNNNQNMPTALSNGLVGYWKMDEASWTNNCSTESVLDSSGNSNNGAACPNTTGPTGAAGGKFGFAGSFDGSNDYLDVDDSSSLNTTGSWTVSTWFYNSDSTLGASEKYLLSKGDWDTDADSPYRLLSNFGTMQIQYRKDFTAYTLGYDYSGAGIYAIDQWIHVTGTYDASTRSLAMYFNGKLVAGPTVQADVYEGNTSALYIGAHSPGSGIWDGKIDETRIYNRALSSAEASQLYNWAPGPNAYWKLDEGAGSTAYDSSGNGNNSTSIDGTPTWTSGKYGKTINFDGTNDAVNINESTTTDFGKAGQSYTVMAWARNSTSNTVNQPILTKNASSDAPGVFALQMDWTTNQAQFMMTNSAWTIDSSVNGTTNIRDGKWHHIVGIRNEDTNLVYMYVDGKLEGTATDDLADTDISSDRAVIIGSVSNAGSFWPGQIDEVKLYNYARTPAQIVEDMNAGHPAPGSPVGTPVGFWKFNEGVDDTCSGGSNDVCNSGSGSTTYDGTSTATRTNSGKLSRALDFDGTDDVVTVTNGDGIDLNTNLTNFTFSSWIYPDSDGEADTGQIFNKGANTYLRVDNQGTTDLDLECNLDRATTDTNVNVADALTTGTWSHVGCAWDGTTLSVFVNGALRGSSTSGSGAISADANNLLIGGGTSNNFDGKIDEFKVYNSALTASQLALDANAASAQILGATGNNSTAGALNAESQEYCIPGDSTTCTVPVGRWDFETQSSNNQTHYDISGNANNCTDFNGKALSTGKIGKATDIVDGVGGSMSCGSGSTLDNLPASGMTIEGWIYPDSAGEFNQGMIARKNGYYVNGWWFNFNSSGTNSLGFNSDHATTDLARTTANNTVTLNTWNHVALTWTGSTTATTVKIYINGRETTYSTTTDGVGARASDAAEDWAFGDDGGGTASFDGKIDQFRAFNYVRTPAQIAYDYNLGAPVAYWKLDECQGTTINDSAGNSLSGTWSGSGGTYTSPGSCAVSSASSAWYNGAAGKRNYSLAFDGSDDIVDFGTPTKLNLSDSITMAVWVKPDSTALGANYHAMIGNYDGGGTTAQYEFAFKDGNLNYNYGASSSYVEYTPTTSISFTAGNWYHIIFTHSGSNSTGYFYVNGVKYATNRTGSASIPTSGFSNTTLGRGGPSGDYFSGQIDDFKIFNYTFNDSLAKTLYNQGAANYAPVSGAP